MWKPILLNSKDLYNVKIREIARCIEKKHKNEKEFGLLSGKMGIAIFCFYYYRYSNVKRFEDIGIEILSIIFENIEKINTFSFSEGHSGIFWAVRHLVDNGFIDLETESIFKKISIPLKQNMIFEVNENNYDYLHGAMGNGLFFNSYVNHKYSVNALNELIQGIFDISIEDKKSQGLKWSSMINPEQNLRGYNLGLAHGISSIIAFQIKLIEKQINNKLAYKIAEGASIFLINQIKKNKGSISSFPNWILKEKNNDNSRLAWCHGDHGISITLWRVSKILNSKLIEDISINVLKQSAHRKDLKVNSIFDAMLCHGACGIAHIFDRMYNYTQIEDFKTASVYWFEQTLNMAHFKDGLAGYKTYFGDSQWNNLFGMLDGIAGIGLSLISAVSDIEPKWDECLLLS